MRRKAQAPQNAFWIAAKGYRPRFVDSGGGKHQSASAAFYRVANLVFKKLDTGEFSDHAKSAVSAMLS